jgi:hypothetical protein
MHEDAVGQETPLTSLGTAPRASWLAWIVQAVPFQRSASVTGGA